MKTIPVYKSTGHRRWGQVVQVGETIVDDDDYERFHQFRWNLQTPERSGVSTPYVCRKCLVGDKYRTLYLHREILGLGPLRDDPREVDHKDHNGLNNQKGNLRIATKSQNQQNRNLIKTSTTGLRGITYHANRWILRLKIDGTHYHLGCWIDRDDAAYASHYAINLVRGEFGNPGSIEGLTVDQEKIETQVREHLRRHNLLPPGTE
jgi:hypothetical protein